MSKSKKKNSTHTKKNKNYSNKLKKKTKSTKISKNSNTSIIHNFLKFQNHDKKPIDYKTYHYTPKLKGGRYVDKGSFGCIITPALPCSKTDTNLQSSISKIVHDTDNDSVSNELEISNILRKLDPEQQFYITIDKYCYIHKIPQDRKDLISVRFKDDDLTEYNSVDKTGKDKNTCDIDLDMNPINLIMPYAGISLKNIMKTDMRKEHKSIRATMHKIFINNFRTYFKHLLIGLLKMHNNRIVNRDIKEQNIMLYWKRDHKDHRDHREHRDNNSKSDNTQFKNNDDNTNANDIMVVRYIDFGLSSFLTSSICKNSDNIYMKGTFYYLSPDLLICNMIKKYNHKTEEYQMEHIMKYVNKYMRKSLLRIGEKNMLSKLNENIKYIYDKIIYIFKKEHHLESYFGSDTNKLNGYLQKGDVYALGITLYECLSVYSNINVKKLPDLYDLFLKMIDFDPYKRYNVSQCLSHPYFTKKNPG